MSDWVPIHGLKPPSINLQPWTRPDGTPRCKYRPKWFCPKCLAQVKGGMGIKKHKEECKVVAR